MQSVITEKPGPSLSEVEENVYKNYKIYDDEELQQDFVIHDDNRDSSVLLSLDGITCPSCCYKIESTLNNVDAIKNISINYSTNTAEVTWDNHHIKLSRILQQIHDLGFRAWPFHHQRREQDQAREKREQLLRIGCAALFGMQVMMISFGLYFGAWEGMDARMESFLRWVVLIFTLPVLLFSGKPFYQNAWRDLKNHTLSMDVPVVIGLSIAFVGSVIVTIQQSGEVYFDSICMLILFLLISRFFEFRTRLQSNQHMEKLFRVIPPTANLITDAENNVTEIPAIKLQPGDRILVRPGETIPVDGIVISGTSSVDESLLTGESRPQRRCEDDSVIAGSTNSESPLIVKVSAIGKQTRLNQLIQLVERSNRDKPVLAQLINRIAGWFILAIVILAAGTGLYWYQQDASQWLPVTLSVLVITCPCALSLATPTALTAAQNTVLARGVAVLGQNVLQTLAQATTFIFDKTGTLTDGKLSLLDITPHSETSTEECHALAAALESQSEHPIGKAICSSAPSELPAISDIVNHPGEGISASIDHKTFYLGNSGFIKQYCTDKIPGHERNETTVFLASRTELLCEFSFKDNIRTGVIDTVSYLQSNNIKPVILSGDNEVVVQTLASKLHIENWAAEKLPEEKIDYLREHCTDQEVCVMIGDGVNDAPALAGSHLSIAMGSGADLAKLNADLVLLHNSLAVLPEIHQAARNCVRIIKQNIGWAILYNLVAVPVAMTGVLAPWQAALGMSLSSLLVVGNSARLRLRKIS